MFDSDKPNRAKQWFAFGLMCIGLFIAQEFYPPTFEVVIIVYVLNLFAVLEWWTYDIDFLMWRRSVLGDGNLELPKAIAEAVPTPRKVIDLNEKDNIWQQSVEVNLHQPDKRWQQFGYAICNGQPMTQSKWTGKGRPFSKPEFVPVINGWLEKQIVKKSKGNASPVPNGSQGWQYFKDLADGRKYIPLPTKEAA